MKQNHFVFADLSTHDLEVAKSFYSQLFNWEYITEDGSYFMATSKGDEIAGVYETPQKFKAMKMPSFWMSYIQVESVGETVEEAKKRGGIVELMDTENIIGAIALIRDPLGAGFTIYEGDILEHRYENKTNALVWNELFISDINKIKPFYEGIFNWKISKTQDNRYSILDTQERTIGNITVLGNDIKGPYEYWGIFLAVEDVAVTKGKALKHGGALIYEDDNLTALADPLGAFFHIVPLERNKGGLPHVPPSKSIRWKPILGLGLILCYLLTGWSWIWAIFFAFWIFQDIRSGRTHLLETIERKLNPTLYWVVVGIWALLGLYSILYYYSIQ